MKRLIAIILLGLVFLGITLAFSGCSEQKKIARSVKKHGAKEIATYIAKNYPEYLRADTVRFEKIIEVPVEVKVPEYVHDTTLRVDTINDCRGFYYNDSRIEFQVAKIRSDTKVKYTIKEKIVKDTAQAKVNEVIPCPPCAEKAVLDNLRMQLQEEQNKKLYLNPLFWIPWVLLFITFFLIYFFKGKQ